MKRNSETRLAPGLSKQRLSFNSTSTNDKRGVCPFCIKTMEEADVSRKTPEDLAYQLTVNQIIKLYDYYTHSP